MQNFKIRVMKLRFLKFSIALLSLIVHFTSCEKDKNNVVDKNKTVELFSRASERYFGMIEHFEVSPVSSIFAHFDMLMKKANDGAPQLVTYYNAFQSTMLHNRLVPSFLNLFILSKEYFNHDAFNRTGVYTWSDEGESWTLVEEGDNLIYIFPTGLSEYNEVKLSFEKYGTTDFDTPSLWEIELNFHSEPLALIKYEIWESSHDADVNLYFSIYPYGTYAMVVLQDQDEGLDVTYLKSYSEDDVAFHKLDVEIAYQGLTHTDYFNNSNFNTIAPFIILGGFIEHTGFVVPISFDVKEFLNHTSNKEVADFANRHFKIDFKTFPSDEVMGNCRWYYNQHEGILEPFIVFNTQDEEPLLNHFPHLEPVFLLGSGIEL